MTVPIGLALVWLAAGIAAVGMFYIAWRAAYSDLDALPVDDPEVQRITAAVLEDAEVAALDALYEMAPYEGSRP